MLLRVDDDFGMMLSRGVTQLPLWVSAVSRLVVAGLFLAAGVAAIRRTRSRPARPRVGLLLPVALIALGTIVVWPFRDQLPPLIDAAGMEALIADPDGYGRLPGITPLAFGLTAATVVLLFGAAVLFRFTAVDRGPVSDAYLAVGLVIAAFAELHYAFYPTAYSSLVTASDFIRLLSFGVLLLGAYADQREDLRALRVAYASLDRLRVTEAERAALEERSRLAREIHDGLAQHLWFAKLKFERLAASVPAEERPLAGEVGQALDSAIVEARQALVTMRTSLDTELPLAEMIGRTVDDFGQRSGIAVSFTPGPGLPVAIPPRQQIELMRVVQEALTNVRKHADATVVRVRAELDGRDLVVAVTDNGRGFDPSVPVEGGLGLQGMDERARLMGGSLRVTSEPQGGTTIALSVPLLMPEWVPGIGDQAGADATSATRSGAAPESAGLRPNGTPPGPGPSSGEPAVEPRPVP
jgi:signal transduction histidine kinase